MKSNLPGLEGKEIIESKPNMVKQFGCGPLILFIILLLAFIL